MDARLKDLRLIKTLSHKSQAALLKSARIQKARRNDTLVQQGDMLASVFLLLNGTLRIYTANAEGREATLYMLNDGEVCLLSLNAAFSNGRYPAWVSVESDAAAMALLKRWPALPASLLVMLAATVSAHALGLDASGVQSVGAVAAPTWQWRVPALSQDVWLQVVELAFGLLILVFAESWGSIRSLALAHGDRVDANRELWVLGGCNLVSAVMQGMPVGAGFSASAANAASGATSKAAALCALAVVGLAMVFALPELRFLPRPVLAVAVIGALWHALNPRPLIEVWRMDRDRALIVGSVLAVLLLGVLHGMLAAIGLSLLASLRRFSQPVLHELGRLDGSDHFMALDAHPDAVTSPDVLVLRPEEPLFFASAERVVGEVGRRVREREAVRTVVLSLEETADLDSTAAECLLELDHHLRQQGRSLLLSRVKDPVRELLSRWDPQGLGAQGRMFLSVADAVRASQQQGPCPCP